MLGSQGRATVEMDVSLKEVRNKGAASGKLRMVLDGYNAPLTAGNFLDLVDRKFYDNTEIQRADGFVVQTGDPEGDVSNLAFQTPVAIFQSPCQHPFEGAVTRMAKPMLTGVTCFFCDECVCPCHRRTATWILAPSRSVAYPSR